MSKGTCFSQTDSIDSFSVDVGGRCSAESVRSARSEKLRSAEGTCSATGCVSVGWVGATTVSSSGSGRSSSSAGFSARSGADAAVMTIVGSVMMIVGSSNVCSGRSAGCSGIGGISLVVSRGSTGTAGGCGRTGTTILAVCVNSCVAASVAQDGAFRICSAMPRRSIPHMRRHASKFPILVFCRISSSVRGRSSISRMDCNSGVIIIFRVVTDHPSRFR